MGMSNWNDRSVIFKEGEPAEKLYLVKNGEVLCVKFSQDRLIPIFLAKEGDMIGESAMVYGSSYDYSAISLESAVLHEISTLSFKEIFKDAPEGIEQLIKTMLSRYQDTSHFIAQNRVIDSLIIPEEFYTPLMENDFKKLLSNKIE